MNFIHTCEDIISDNTFSTLEVNTSGPKRDIRKIKTLNSCVLCILSVIIIIKYWVLQQHNYWIP